MYRVDLHLKGETTESALYHLKQAIALSRKQHEKVLCAIVGYGSRGGTHKIQTAVLQELAVLKEKKQVKDYIIGSDMDLFSPRYQQLKGKEWIPEEVKRAKNPGEVIIIL
ncbi:MAG TPA: hypothetical protein IAD46_00155 [Candidatus Pelethenecus faecipullorum]|uniref:Smr domain-containing protein n=1 Tax=Candidatus Pelethenecus faecipullorum TaxID=2840900 RepID=A0A9D1GPF6_9MOLU|nr:hypothetical protein [Candidatus Pelethenecus faecipullorum]